MDTNAQITKSISLEKYGIVNVPEIIYNPSYEFLYNEELNPRLQGFEKGQLSELGAINVMTGEFTGRSPKDKYIVKDNVTENTVWWNSDKAANDNKPIKYFKYAIGEIVLVVFGILIALQVNTCNQNRLDSKEEKQLLLFI